MTDAYLPAVPQSPDLSYLLPKEEPLALGYRDTNYTPAPKLYKDEVLATVGDLKAEHSVRIAQSKQYSHFLDCGTPGTFKEDEDLIADDIIETMPLLGEREEYEFRIGWMAGHDPYPRLLNRDLIDRDEAIAVEDRVTADFQCEERQYARRHRSDYRLAEAAHFCRFGMLAGLDVLDPLDRSSGLAMDLLDPLTIFPVWGGQDGLLECYRVYEDTNEAIIGTHGGKPGSKEYERIRGLVEKSATKTKRGRRNVMVRNQLRTVTEAWSYDELYVILDEEVELLRRSHGYRRVPITIRVGAFDQPVGVSIGTQWENMGEPRLITTTWGEISASGASMDLARQLRPFGWRHVWAHQIAEAVAGRGLSIFKWAIDPAKILEYDPSTEFRMTEEIDLLPGQTNKIPVPNKLNLVTPVIDPNVFAGLAANLQSNVGGGFLTQMRLGAIPPQTSGSAMGKLQAAGGAAEVTLVRGLQGFKRDRAEWRLELRKTHGDAIGDPLGVVRTPARRGAGTPMHEITPKLLERSGTEVDIELYQWQPDVPLMTYITGLRTPSPLTGKPLISDETAQRKLKVTPDPDREADRINDEALGALPPVAMQRDLARMERTLEEAMASGDDEDAARLMQAIAELEYLHDLAISQGTASPPGGPGAMGAGGATTSQAMPPAPPVAGPAPSMGNTSLPDQGVGVGTQGGRPIGAAGPTQPISQPTPISGVGGP